MDVNRRRDDVLDFRHGEEYSPMHEGSCSYWTSSNFSCSIIPYFKRIDCFDCKSAFEGLP